MEHRSCGGGRFTCTRDPGPGRGGGGWDGVRTNCTASYFVNEQICFYAISNLVFNGLFIT